MRLRGSKPSRVVLLPVSPVVEVGIRIIEASVGHGWDCCRWGHRRELGWLLVVVVRA